MTVLKNLKCLREGSEHKLGDDRNNEQFWYVGHSCFLAGSLLFLCEKWIATF